jgi:hypothetical protein
MECINSLNTMMSVEELKEIGHYLFKQGWQTRFAEYLGITPQHFRRYVSGKTKISKSRENQIRMMVYLKKNGLFEDYQVNLIQNTLTRKK